MSATEARAEAATYRAPQLPATDKFECVTSTSALVARFYRLRSYSRLSQRSTTVQTAYL